MLEVARDLVTEADDLHGFLQTLQPGAWQEPTRFMDWTPWDVVAHLHYFDVVSLAALEGADAFAKERDRVVQAISGGKTNAEVHRERFGHLGADLLGVWHDTCREMARQLGESDPKRRLPWFGPDMGVRMFTTARFMETWAHGQAVHDLAGHCREPTDRLRHVAEIGVRTYGWTFVNRQREVPGPPPYVRLDAPSGAVWEFNDPSDESSVRGSALEFCQVVTQTRNVADTSLEVRGEVATAWMEIAQCFAGGPVDPPKPGLRTGG